MRQLLLILLSTLILASCSHPNTKSQSITFLQPVQQFLPNKDHVSSDYRNIYQFKLKSEPFSAGGDWFDDASFLYITHNTQEFHIYRYQLYSKVNDLFYSNPLPILRVEANNNHSLFAVQLGGKDAMFNVLNQYGNVIYQWKGKAMNYEIQWNPYDSDAMLLVVYHEDWSFDVYSINVKTKVMQKLPLQEPFAQWMGSQKIGYFKWMHSEYTNESMLSILNIKTKETNDWLNHIINYFTIGKDIGLVLNANPDNTTSYSFYHLSDRKKIAEFKLPNLQSYSEAWWMPYDQYLVSNDSFYYFYPIQNGKNGSVTFDLKQFQLNDKKQETIVHQLKNAPIKLSSNGEWAMYGNRFDNVLSMETHKLIHLG